jgi:uncharacterized protein involved in outer membrane biogenesis
MDDSAPDSKALPHRQRLLKFRTPLIVVAVLLLLYTLSGFLLLPHFARNAIVGYVQRDLGRRASIGELDFNPFTFGLEVHQFSLAEADGRPLLSFDLLRVEASMLASLLNRAWTLSEVRLERPRIEALIGRDGALNLAQLAPPVKPEQPKPEASALPPLRIGALGVHGGSIHFEDQSRSEPFSTTLAPIEFDLSDFRTAPKFQNKYRFSAQSAANERLDWAGQFTLQPLGSSGEFTVTELKAATIANYLQGALPFELRGGSLDVQGNYQLVASPATALALTLPSLKVHSLEIAPRQVGTATTTPWISLPELEVANTSVALNEHRVAVGQITLQRAALQVWRNPDGSLNLQQLLSPAGSSPASSPAADAPASAAAPASAPWLISLDRLEIQDASIDVEDRSIQPVFKTRLGAIGLTARNYSSAGATPLTFDLHLKLGDSGQLQTQGAVTLASLDTAIDVTLSNLDLPALQPYIAQATDLTLYRGRLGVKGHVAYAGAPAHGHPKLQLALAIDVSDLATRDNLLHEDLVSWRSLRIDGLNYQMAPDALSIEHILADGAYGRVVVGPQGGLNVAQILRPARLQAAAPAAAAPAPPAPKAAARGTRAKSAATAAAASAPKAPSMQIRIARIDIKDATADFTDRSITPNFSTAIYGLNGSVAGLSSDPASRATVTLDGSVDRYAPVSIKGQLNVLSARTFTDIGMSFSNIELPTFNPYSGKFAGYNIAQGKLTTEIHYHVENRKLDATHHIVIDQLEFGAATESKQAVPLPIKLAVALLKDRNGVIDLDLPVGGSLDDPTFRIAPIIWKVFVNLIEKAVTAPFALLGRMFGGGPQLSYIDFPTGVATLTAEQQQKLSQLATALVERPQLKLDIPLHTQGGDDDSALERAVLDHSLRAVEALDTAKPRASAGGTAGGAGAGEDARFRALVVLYRTQYQADPDYPPEIANGGDAAARANWIEQQLLPAYAPTAAQRDELGLARAQAVQSALLANPELKPERVFLTNQVSGGGEEGTVRMELKLE